MTEKQELTKLNDFHIENIYHLVLDIATELQIRPSSWITVAKESLKRFELLNEFNAKTTPSEDQKARNNSVYFLINRGIISRADVISTLPGAISRFNTGDIEEYGNGKYIKLNVDITKFTQFQKNIQQIYLTRLKKKRITSEPSNAPVKTSSSISDMTDKTNKKYEIKYDTYSGKITLNGELLHKTDLDSENDKVFQCLFNNPDIVITKENLKTQCKIKRMKPLSKIVDNLKFTGDLRKAFFGRIARDSIKFRKIVYQNDLKELKISSLTVNKHP